MTRLLIFGVWAFGSSLAGLAGASPELAFFLGFCFMVLVGDVAERAIRTGR